MEISNADMIGGVIFFAVGAAAAFLNYMVILRRVLKSAKSPTDMKPVLKASVIRGIINILVLVLAYLAGGWEKMDCSVMATLLGAVLGLTIPSAFLANRAAGVGRSPDGGDD